MSINVKGSSKAIQTDEASAAQQASHEVQPRSLNRAVGMVLLSSLILVIGFEGVCRSYFSGRYGADILSLLFLGLCVLGIAGVYKTLWVDEQRYRTDLSHRPRTRPSALPRARVEGEKRDHEAEEDALIWP